jgi:hypothetical protein
MSVLATVPVVVPDAYVDFELGVCDDSEEHIFALSLVEASQRRQEGFHLWRKRKAGRLLTISAH